LYLQDASTVLHFTFAKLEKVLVFAKFRKRGPWLSFWQLRCVLRPEVLMTSSASQMSVSSSKQTVGGDIVKQNKI